MLKVQSRNPTLYTGYCQSYESQSYLYGSQSYLYESHEERTKKTRQKTCKVGSAIEAVSALVEKLPAFLSHVLIKRKESDYFQTKLSNIPKGRAVIQVDFSENYSLQQQGEI